MESYCVRCKKHTKNINLKVSYTSNGKTIKLSKCAEFSSKKSNQERKGLLSSFGLRTPLRKYHY